MAVQVVEMQTTLEVQPIYHKEIQVQIMPTAEAEVGLMLLVVDLMAAQVKQVQ
jgi:hypothetical protein